MTKDTLLKAYLIIVSILYFGVPAAAQESLLRAWSDFFNGKLTRSMLFQCEGLSFKVEKSFSGQMTPYLLNKDGVFKELILSSATEVSLAAQSKNRYEALGINGNWIDDAFKKTGQKSFALRVADFEQEIPFRSVINFQVGEINIRTLPTEVKVVLGDQRIIGLTMPEQDLGSWRCKR